MFLFLTPSFELYFSASNILSKNSYYSTYTVCSGGSRISRRGGVDLVGGGVDSRGGYISKILYVKMKELGPLGGARAGRAPPRSANGVYPLFSHIRV